MLGKEDPRNRDSIKKQLEEPGVLLDSLFTKEVVMVRIGPVEFIIICCIGIVLLTIAVVAVAVIVRLLRK